MAISDHVVLALAAEVFQRPVDPADTLFDLGVDSLRVVEFAMRLEELTGSEVDVAHLLSGATLGQLATDLTAGLGAETGLGV